MNIFKSPEFLSLRVEWYERLKDLGFKDLENLQGHLKPDIDQRTLNRSMADKAEREAYYDRALSHLDLVAQVGSRDWTIWFYHCEGLTIRNIAELVQAHPATVQFRVKKMRKLAGLG